MINFRLLYQFGLLNIWFSRELAGQVYFID